MKLESQVCSLELSKRLKELGVKQESYFIWAQINKNEWEIIPEDDSRQDDANYDDVSTFTVAELGEMLPQSINREHLKIGKTADSWIATYPGEAMMCNERTFADTLAQMLIYLLENKLINPEKDGGGNG